LKYLRTLILVLLAVLLPIRGAVAAAMLCPDGVGTAAAAALSEHAHHDHDGHGDAGTHAHHAAQGAAGGEKQDDSSSGSQPNTCHFCASGCCVTPLAFAPPTIAEPLLTASITFPALQAPVPAFHSGGQDRPPRTI